MENTAPKPAPKLAPKLAYATPEQLAALRRNQTQRLYDMAEALLQAFEAVDIPKDIAGINRAAKALVTLNTMMRTLYDAQTSMAARPEREYYDKGTRQYVMPPPPTAEGDAATLATWLPGLMARLKYLEDMRKARKTVDGAEGAIARCADG